MLRLDEGQNNEASGETSGDASGEASGDADDKIKCEVVFAKDSNSNDQNIFLMVPQYVVITIGEVLLIFVKITFHQRFHR